jgi:hypothetical protein
MRIRAGYLPKEEREIVGGGFGGGGDCAHDREQDDSPLRQEGLDILVAALHDLTHDPHCRRRLRLMSVLFGVA